MIKSCVDVHIPVDVSYDLNQKLFTAMGLHKEIDWVNGYICDDVMVWKNKAGHIVEVDSNVCVADHPNRYMQYAEKYRISILEEDGEYRATLKNGCSGVSDTHGRAIVAAMIEHFSKEIK